VGGRIESGGGRARVGVERRVVKRTWREGGERGVEGGGGGQKGVVEGESGG